MNFVWKLSGMLLLFVGLSAFTLNSTSNVETEEEKINWLSIEEALELSKDEPRKLIIDIYTDWCGWCKRMDKETFRHPDIVKYVNRNYYAVKLNGESKETITLGERDYNFIPTKGKKGVHELADYLMRGNPTYPSVAFLDEKMAVITVEPGYKEPRTMDKVLRYIGDNHYQNTPWAMFDRTYRSKIKKSKKRK